MRRIAAISALAALMAGAPLVEALAQGGCCRPGRRAHHYRPSPYVSPFDAWRAYYGVQAEISFARRAGRAKYYSATGKMVPSRYFGPPTNTYAEHYALNPWSYFNCPLARRGDGVCPYKEF